MKENKEIQDAHIEAELKLEIENMYFDEVVSGRYTKPGSFIARSKSGREFFVSKELTRKKNKLINMLYNEVRPLWVLVEDEIWGGKWENKKVSRILIISENKNDCEVYKTNLINRLQIKLDLTDLFKQQMTLIQNCYGESSFEHKIKALEISQSVLREKLLGLNIYFDDVDG